MTLKQLKDYFKAEFGWTDDISIGKVNNDKEKAICFYPGRSPFPAIPVIGGRHNKDYHSKAVTVVLRWMKNADAAEIKASEIYSFFNERQFNLDGERIFVTNVYDEPVSMGSDGSGVYEYSFDFIFYITRKAAR